MRVGARFLLPALVLLASLVEAQDGGFQLPVQLIGFPVIIMAVRISNFMKKLAYAVNPRTYARRTRRALEGKSGVAALGGAAGGAAPDPATVEKLLLNEFGARVCVYERVCAQYAQRALAAHGHNQLLDWDTVFSRYKSAPPGEKQNYLLSVFLGDMVRSPSLCLGLAKRGRSCTAMEAAEKSINHLREHRLPTSTSRSVTSSSSSSSSSTIRRRTKPHTHVPAAHHQSPSSSRHPEHHVVEHHHVESHQERRRQPSHPAAHHAPVHRQPARPSHHPDAHHSEVHRKADHPAQVARHPRPARRRPTTHVED